MLTNVPNAMQPEKLQMEGWRLCECKVESTLSTHTHIHTLHTLLYFAEAALNLKNARSACKKCKAKPSQEETTLRNAKAKTGCTA